MQFLQRIFGHLRAPPVAGPAGVGPSEPLQQKNEGDIGARIARDRASSKGHLNEDHRNKRFADLNGNGRKFTNCDFSYSIFERGYFHKAVFENCNFVGCRFYDCNFREVRFNSCDFRYTTFHGTLLPAQEIIPNLPPQPNLRRDVLQQLKVNAMQVGDIEGARNFTDQEIRATYDHLIRAIRGSEHYYREKYPATWDKIAISIKLISHGMSGFFWGHGERPWRLVMSLFTLLFVCCLLNSLSIPSQDEFSVGEYVVIASLHSFDVFLGISSEMGKYGFAIIDYVLVILRYIYIGLLIAVLEKFISFR